MHPDWQDKQPFKGVLENDLKGALAGGDEARVALVMATHAGMTTEHFALLVHHTDAEREWAYDRESPGGKLDKALEEASQHGWTVVDMKRD